MPLSFHRMLAPVRFAPAVCGQYIWIDANLPGDENNKRRRWLLAKKERATTMVQIAKLDGQAETVMRGPLGLDQIKIAAVERAVPDQALLVDRHVDKSRPLTGFEKRAAQPPHPSGTCLRWIAQMRFTWLSLHPANFAVRLIDCPAPRNATMR